MDIVLNFLLEIIVNIVEVNSEGFLNIGWHMMAFCASFSYVPLPAAFVRYPLSFFRCCRYFHGSLLIEFMLNLCYYPNMKIVIFLPITQI